LLDRSRFQLISFEHCHENISISLFVGYRVEIPTDGDSVTYNQYAKLAYPDSKDMPA
jgi:hypothetical protein